MTNSTLRLPTRLYWPTDLTLSSSNSYAESLQIKMCSKKSCQIWHLLPTNAKGLSSADIKRGTLRSKTCLVMWVLECEMGKWLEMKLLGLLSLLFCSNGYVLSGWRTSVQSSWLPSTRQQLRRSRCRETEAVGCCCWSDFVTPPIESNPLCLSFD